MIPPEPVSVEEFMRRALHDPLRGYYARRISAIGNRGDFTTAPMLSAAPALAIARWAVRSLKESGCRDLIEIGPGEGSLMRDVIARFPLLQRMRTRFHLVETSAPLREKQRALLGRRVTWHDHPAVALAACGGNAVIFSNELVDAFPIRVFRKSAEAWREVFVSAGPLETLVETPLPDSSVWEIPFPEGQQVEIHESYHHWLATWLPLWRRGRMLTIDYGAQAAALYHRRPRGTLRGYLLQQRMEGMEIYQNPGRQDLTADVNFTDLIRWANGRLASRIMNLAEFFAMEGVSAPPALLEGAGSAFLVLEQSPLDESRQHA